MLEVLLERATRAKVPSLVYTFEPPPRVVLAPQHHVPRISPWPDKVRLLIEFGVEHVVVERFTRAFAQHPPEWFADRILRRRLGAQAIVVGYDFRFGQGRTGTAEALRAHGVHAGIEVAIVPAVTVDGEIAASTKIRGHLRAGELARAERMLGRPWDVDGVVVHGAERGRAIGVPTANIVPEVELAIAPGIYAVTLGVEGGPAMPAVASLGTNPTFVDDGGLVLEVHVLDWTGDLYDRRVRTTFIARLRDEQKFESVEALVSQIGRDIAQARAVLAR
jgi:riboflavin kinase/FMN adenylyltransferase